MKRQKGFTLMEMLTAGAVIGLGIGWVLNIITIVHAIAGPVTMMLVLRIVGVFFAPLGGVLGWI